MVPKCFLFFVFVFARVMKCMLGWLQHCICANLIAFPLLTSSPSRGWRYAPCLPTPYSSWFSLLRLRRRTSDRGSSWRQHANLPALSVHTRVLLLGNNLWKARLSVSFAKGSHRSCFYYLACVFSGTVAGLWLRIALGSPYEMTPMKARWLLPTARLYSIA